MIHNNLNAKGRNFRIIFLKPSTIILCKVFLRCLLILFFSNRLCAKSPALQDSAAADIKISENKPLPNLLWLSTQIVPSPEVVFRKNGETRFGMRWQITPLLYSYGINRRLGPWRYFIAEPIVRQNGSIELYFTPEWMNMTDHFYTNWLFRGGLRWYFPLYRYGEYLSGSLSTSYYNFNGGKGVSYEAGLYIFFGILGLQASYSPDMKEAPWILTLRIRYF